MNDQIAGLDTRAETPPPRPGTVDLMIDAAVDHLLNQQRDDGHWCAELEGDTILESEYVLLLYFLGRSDPRIAKCCERLRSQQLRTGGWSTYPSGPVDVSVSVKAYLCLKLVGDHTMAPHMIAARSAIRNAGGLHACNSYTKLYLSIFGLWSWLDAPAVPPELILLPRWFYFNLYEMSAWTRTIVVPLSVVWAHKPSVQVEIALDELDTGNRPQRNRSFWSWVFAGVNTLIQCVEAIRLTPFRRRALEKAKDWMIERIEASDGLGAIFPAIVNAVLALRCLGYEEGHPLVQRQLRELERFAIEEDREIRLQPCFSPVWDTALSVDALIAAGTHPRDPAIQHALAWLLDHEVQAPGDWQCHSLHDVPGGWCFEYRNDHYPDCDDTAEVLSVLAAVRGQTSELETRRQDACARGAFWLVGMQSDNGGWGAFDRNCDKQVLTRVPFADHNAMIDPATVDVTARAVSALLAHGYQPADPCIRRAVDFLLREQEADGSWYGRWGCNYIYGSWLALTALREVVIPMPDASINEAIRRGCNWLLTTQNQDGGWGESLRSYQNSCFKGCGLSTATQTAWAMLGLLAAVDSGPGRDDVVLAALDRAVAFLQERQLHDGAWFDHEWTGVGFPGVFNLRYAGYAQVFPIAALVGCRRLAMSDQVSLDRLSVPN